MRLKREIIVKLIMHGRSKYHFTIKRDDDVINFAERDR